MPTTAYDVLVIGGGVIGLSAAYRLRARGLRVLLLERSQCGREASWAGAGMLIPPNPHRHGAMPALARHSLDLYPSFCAELAEYTGIDPEYEVCGALDVLDSEQRYRMARADERAGADQKLPDGAPVFQVLTPEAGRALAPALDAHDARGVMHIRSAAQMRNPRLMQALHAACLRGGVEIRERTAVTELICQGERVIGAAAGNQQFHAGTVVLCAGAWSSGLDPRLAGLMPVHPVRGQIVLLWLPERPFGPLILARSNYLVPRRDGHVLLGTTEEHDSGFAKRNTPTAVADMTTAALRLVPRLADAAVVGMWSGLRPGTPDRRPYLGPVPGMHGLIAATGHFRNGLTLAPATAAVVCDLVTTGATPLDLTPCRPGRRQTLVRG